MSGHSVLQLPVAHLEDWVVARHRHYDPGFVSDDPRFGHAHVTALGPWLAGPDPADLGEVGAIAATTPPIDVTFASLGQFPSGIIHLRPEPRAPISRLTDRLVAAFPGHPPYGGRFGRAVEPHLTLDAASDDAASDTASEHHAGISVASTREMLGGLLPVTCVLDVLQLAWWESGACRVLHEWALAG